MRKAAEVSIPGPTRAYSPAEITRIIARYNGDSDYGDEVKPIYDIFEQFNAALR